MQSGMLKSPVISSILKAFSRGIQLPKRGQSQSIGAFRVYMTPSALPVKEASLIEERRLKLCRYSTEAEGAELSTKATPATERDSLSLAQTTPPDCGCEERAG